MQGKKSPDRFLDLPVPGHRCSCSKGYLTDPSNPSQCVVDPCHPANCSQLCSSASKFAYSPCLCNKCPELKEVLGIACPLLYPSKRINLPWLQILKLDLNWRSSCGYWRQLLKVDPAVCMCSGGSAVCSCKSGYVIIPSQPKQCALADVCSALQGAGCQGSCVNNPPGQGFRCACTMPGFVLASDGKSCLSKLPALGSLVFVSRCERVSPHGFRMCCSHIIFLGLAASEAEVLDYGHTAYTTSWHCFD